MWFSPGKVEIPTAEKALTGRDIPLQISGNHFVNGNPLKPPFPRSLDQIVFALGCFWGAERLFWEKKGVYTTAVGYIAGHTKNPTYEEVCSGMTGHTEAVLVVFDPEEVNISSLLNIFWEGHDPTQGMRQGNDVGTQYRSGVYVLSSEQKAIAIASKEQFGQSLAQAGYGVITSEIIEDAEFFYAENDHQQYLAKNPGGYCGLGGTGVRFPLS